jgi:hypothetical protein
MKRRYIGMDIGKEKCILALIDEAGNIQLRELSSPSQLMRILQPHDMIAAEYTGALATKWLDTTLQCTDEVYIYRTQGIRADKRVVGNRDKNDQHDATAIAKLLKIQTELASPRFMPYRQLKEVFHLRRIVYEAERFTTETVRAKNLIQNAQATGYQIHHPDYLKTLEELEKQAWKRAEQAIKDNEIAPLIYIQTRNCKSSHRIQRRNLHIWIGVDKQEARVTIKDGEAFALPRRKLNILNRHQATDHIKSHRQALHSTPIIAYRRKPCQEIHIIHRPPLTTAPKKG